MSRQLLCKTSAWVSDFGGSWGVCVLFRSDWARVCGSRHCLFQGRRLSASSLFLQSEGIVDVSSLNDAAENEEDSGVGLGGAAGERVAFCKRAFRALLKRFLLKRSLLFQGGQVAAPAADEEKGREFRVGKERRRQRVKAMPT